MTNPDAVSAISGIQQSLAVLRGGATPATTGTTSSASVFGAILAQLTGSQTSAQDAFGQQLVDDAREYLGTPYVLGGTSTSGIDCSGLVKNVLAKHGIESDHNSRTQGLMGTEIPSLAEAKPGDLIVFDKGMHIGIYAGDNKVVHAPSPGRNVVEQELWTDQPYSIRRIEAPASETGTTLPAGVDVTSLLRGLSMLGSLASTLGASGPVGSAPGASALGSSLLGSSALGASLLAADPLGGSGTSSTDLASIELQRWALLQKGIA